MKLTIRGKLLAFLAASGVATVGAIGSFTYLLRSSDAASSAQAAAAKANARSSLALVGHAARVQDLTLKLLGTQDVDAIEGLIGQAAGAAKELEAEVRRVAGKSQELLATVSALRGTNDKAKESFLKGEAAQANQIYIQQSNPAFERLLQGIQRHQDEALRALEEEAAASRSALRRFEFAVAVGIGVVAFAVALLGVALVRNISRALRRIVDRVRDVAEGEGDLTKRLDISSDDELGEIARWLNTFLDKLQQIMLQISAYTNRLASASEQLSAATTEQSRNAEAQSAQAQQVAAAMQEITTTITEVSNNSNDAEESSGQAAQTARNGGSVVEEALSRMQSIAEAVDQSATRVRALGKSSDRIGEIVQVIDEIADQTNLLALNAAIEAARAGEQGRGFAVVADEVRKLAERTVKATQEIGDMVRSIQAETGSAVTAMHEGTALVAQGVDSTRKAGTSLREIIQVSESVGALIAQIATATTEQSSSTEQINLSIDAIARAISESAAASQQAATAVGDLSELALDLQRLVGQFRLSHPDAAG